MNQLRALSHNRDFTALWIGQTISELGTQMSLFVFPLVAWQISHSALATGLAAASSMTGNVLALLPAGILADRVHRAQMMRWASGVGALAFATLVIAGALGQLTIAHLVIVGLISGGCAGTFGPAETSAVRSVVPEEQLATALSQNQAREHVAGLLGGPLGGVLFAITRWLPFVADAVSFVVSWVMVGRIRTDLSPIEHAGPRPRARDELREGFAFVWDRPLYRVLMIWSALVNLILNALFFLAVLRLIQAGFSSTVLGLTEAAAGLAGLLGALVAPTVIDRFRTGSLTITIAWISIPMSIPMIWFNHPIAVVIAIGGTLFLNPAGNAGIGAYRMATTPVGLQGRVASASRFASMIVMPLAPLLAGGMLATLGGPDAMALLLLATAAVAMIVTLSASVRAVPRPAQWRDSPRQKAPQNDEMRGLPSRTMGSGERTDEPAAGAEGSVQGGRESGGPRLTEFVEGDRELLVGPGGDRQLCAGDGAADPMRRHAVLDGQRQETFDLALGHGDDRAAG